MVTIEHISGKSNDIADALSQNEMPRFRREYKAKYGHDPPT